MLKRKGFADFPFLRNVGNVRFFGGVKVSQEKPITFVANFCHKLIASLLSTKQAALAVRPRIFDVADILLIGDGPKVANPVVVSDAVNVVNESIGPNAVHVKPRQPVRLVGLVQDINVNVSGLIEVSGNASFEGHASAFKPSKNSRFGVVMQKLFQSSLRQCKSGFSHVIAPSQRWIGQRIEGVTSTFFPRFNIEGIA